MSAVQTVYVGNLPRAVTTEGLIEHFTKDGHAAISNPKIIRPRSGRVFGFVDVASEADATKLIEAYHDKELDGRKLQVQVARPPNEAGDDQEKRPPRNNYNNNRDNNGNEQRPRRNYNNNNNNNNNNDNDNNNNNNNNTQQRRPRQNVNNNGTNSPADNTNDNANNTRVRRQRAPRTDNGADGVNDNQHSQPRFNNNNNNNNNNKSQSNGAPAAAGDDQKRRARPQRAPRSDEPEKPREKIDPTCTLFVANLPFSVEEEELKTIMKGPIGNVTNARIIRARFSKRSKGFGFVMYDSAAARDAALVHNGTTHGGRALSVNIAKEEPDKKNNAVPASTQ